jgi:hypothetical protein
VTIEVKDLATKDLMRIQQRIMPTLQAATTESLRLVEGKARANVSGKLRVRTGKLLRSVKAGRVAIKRHRVEGQIPADPRAKGSHWYIGKFHEKGAVIRAKKKKYLAIPFPDGTVRFVKQVVLPAQPWLGPAWKSSTRKIREIFKRRILAMVK